MSKIYLGNFKGPKGDQGIQGLTGGGGPKGDKGDKGDQGIQGPKGDTGPVNLTNDINKVESDNYALNAVQNNPDINDTLAYKISNLNNEKLRCKGYYRPDVSINDMLNEGIYRFYVDVGTDNANYLGWSGRTLILCTGNCAGFIYQIFFSEKGGHLAIRTNKVQGVLDFTYDIPLYRIDSRLDTPIKINITSDFADKIMVNQIGKVVSVDIDGYIIAAANTFFASGFPKPPNTLLVQDLMGHNFRLYEDGRMRNAVELNGKEYTNLHFTYITV